jgi:DNA invertase Pin-like site-specific DNA recombinase
VVSKAAAFIRKSQGDEDDVSLQLQRDRVCGLADGLADEVEVIDLGVHTGFSIHMRPSGETRIDTNEDVLTLLECLRAGEYDYLCAWDDTRLARDQFYWEVKRAAIVGNCELEFVEDPPGDELTFRVQRAVESDVKRREIQKSKAALEKREQQGHDQGRPPFGLTYDDAGERWIPDRETGEFQKALDVIDARQSGQSWREVAQKTSVNKNTARRIWERKERYLSEAAEDV